MATRNKRKLAALNKENCEEHPRSNLAQISNSPRSQEDYITQVSEEIEGRVTKKLSQQFSRTENRILGALARLDDFLMNPLIQGHTGTAAETSWNVFIMKQETNEDDSQSNSHPEAGLFINQMEQSASPEDGHDMVTGATEQSRNRLDITGVHEEVNYCYPSTSSGKKGKNRSTSQPQFRCENTPATIETGQILLALQQSANNINSANFRNIINRMSKLPNWLTTTMPTFDGKFEKSCLKIFSKRASKSIISWLKRTQSTTSILSWGETQYKQSKTIMTLAERIWEKFWQFLEGNMENRNRWWQRNTHSRNLFSTQQITG